MADITSAVCPLPSQLPNRDEKETVLSIFERRGVPPGDISAFEGHCAVLVRLIGEAPPAFSIVCKSPSTLRTICGMFSALFDSPAVDLRLPGSLTPRLRREAFHAASAGFGCSYCAAHARAFGDMLLGSVPAQRASLKSEVPVSEIGKDEADQDAESAIVAFASAAVVRPVQDTHLAELRKLADAVKRTVGIRKLESVKAIILMAGAFNTLNEGLGTEIEPSIANFMAGNHDMEEAPLSWSISDSMKWLSRLSSFAIGAMRAIYFVEAEMYSGLPRSLPYLYSWAEERLGIDGASFLRHFSRPSIVRAFCFGLQETTFPDSDCGLRCWNSEQRARFLSTFASASKADYLAPLAEQIVAWQEQNGRGSSTNGLEGAELDEESAQAAVEALAKGNATLPSEVSRNVCERCSPQAVIELVGLVSFFELWRRMVLLAPL